MLSKGGVVRHQISEDVKVFIMNLSSVYCSLSGPPHNLSYTDPQLLLQLTTSELTCNLACPSPDERLG